MRLIVQAAPDFFGFGEMLANGTGDKLLQLNATHCSGSFHFAEKIIREFDGGFHEP